MSLKSKAPSSIATNQGQYQQALQNYKFYSKKTICPCGKHKSFCLIVGQDYGGKCWSTSCGQQFFPPHEGHEFSENSSMPTDYRKAKQTPSFAPIELHSKHLASLEAPLGFHYNRHHIYWNDLGDNYLFRVVVFKSDDGNHKRASQIRYEGVVRLNETGAAVEHGKWYCGLGGTKLTLYRSPYLRLLRNSPMRHDNYFVVVQGEKDADTLHDLGAFATTNPHGALKWRIEYGEHLSGLRCFVIGDCDEVGREHAEDVCKKLKGFATSITRIDLRRLMPNLPNKSDVTDFIQRGGRLWKA